MAKEAAAPPQPASTVAVLVVMAVAVGGGSDGGGSGGGGGGAVSTCLVLVAVAGDRGEVDVEPCSRSMLRTSPLISHCGKIRYSTVNSAPKVPSTTSSVTSGVLRRSKYVPAGLNV